MKRFFEARQYFGDVVPNIIHESALLFYDLTYVIEIEVFFNVTYPLYVHAYVVSYSSSNSIHLRLECCLSKAHDSSQLLQPVLFHPIFHIEDSLSLN